MEGELRGLRSPEDLAAATSREDRCGAMHGGALVPDREIALGPLPALYGTFTLLVLISTVKTLPYSSRAGIAAMMQLDPDLEESAKIHGASWLKRLWRIILPLTKGGFIAGMLLVFISTMRELSLIILLITPQTMPLTAFIFRLQDSATDNFQHACAGVLILVAIIIFFGVVIQKLRGQRDLERIF